MYPVPEAMRQFIFDVRWPQDARYTVRFGAWEFSGLDFKIGANLDEYECTFNHPLDGVNDAGGNTLAWILTDPDPTDPQLYRIDHHGWE